MGSDDFFNKRRKERQKRKEEVRIQKSGNWLIVCEGKQTEPNYFKSAIDDINSKIDEKYKLKINVIGKGMNTLSLVKSTIDYINEIDEYKDSYLIYEKIFVVFDKDDFSNDSFDKAIELCENNGYIPLWSNQAIEYWFLLYFNYIDQKMDRKEYSKKLNEYFKKAGLDYKYKKNDKNIYYNLLTYGSLNNAIKNSKKIHLSHELDKPSLSESCTTVYKFFDSLDERLQELK